MAEFKTGQKIVIKKNMGLLSGYRPINYYYGGTIRDVPLGTKAVIRGKFKSNSEAYIISINKYRNLLVHPNEIDLDYGEIEKEKEAGERFDSFLEKSLLAETKDDAVSQGKFRDLVGRVGSALTDRFRKKEKPFEPKFNTREEFALWVREQFPGLEKYASEYFLKKPKESNFSYSIRLVSYGIQRNVALLGKRKLHKRKEEVRKAAILACEHGIQTTDSCVARQFREYLHTFKENNLYFSNFDKKISTLANFIICLSANMNDPSTRHYGTHINSN